MKKSLIALAIAGAFAAPAFAASSNVDIYGVMSFSLDWANTDDAANDDSDFATGVDNVSRIGFKGAEDLGGGLKALWQIETELNTDAMAAGTLAATGSNSMRNTFVGVAGGFGTLVLGRHDTPYKLATGKLDPFADTIGDYNAVIGATQAANQSSRFDVRAPQTIAYISPNFSGFHAAAAYVEAKANEGAGNDETQAFSIMGMYDNGPLFASLAYETHSGGILGATATQEIDAWKLGLGYSFGDGKVGFVYEDIEHDAAANVNSRSAWYLTGSYAMGPIVLKAAYGNADDSDAAGNDEADFWTIGADYNLSKRTSIYAVYANLDHDSAANQAGASGYGLRGGAGYNAAGTEVSGFSLGIKHSF